MKKASQYRQIIPLIGVLCCILATGCGTKPPEDVYGASSSKVISTSRVVFPETGGPAMRRSTRLMTDTHDSWQPLNDTEPKLSRNGPVLAAGSFDLIAWLPPTETDVMERYLYRLTHSKRDLAIRVLGRAENYLPAILASLSARGLPSELACLPMVESAFEPQAVSPAGAAGLWQLMPDTARRFGLTVNAETDDRFDVEKATDAATSYLAVLYGIFNDWPLALAAYNCGEGAMLRALSTTDTGSLPDLTQACRIAGEYGSPLAEETLRFVPQFAAAVQIMTNSDIFELTPHTMLNLDSGATPAHVGKSSLVLNGRYETDLQPQTIPARSQRIE